MQIMAIIQLVIQLFLKGSMSRLWTLYFAMQLYCYMGILSLEKPLIVTLIS